MKTKQFPTIQEQEQYWKDKEVSDNPEPAVDNATNETRQDLVASRNRFEEIANQLFHERDQLLAALKDVELRATQDRIASNIGRKKNRTDFLRRALDRIVNVAHTAIDASNLGTPEPTTADPKSKDFIVDFRPLTLDQTESMSDWYDGCEREWSLRDEGRNPNGSGESYAERNA